MSTLNDNDLMLIERDGVQYKVESQYVNVGPDGTITSPVEVLTPVDGDGLIVGTQDAVITSAITAVDGNTITFASDVSSSLKAPISMVDANGNPIAPTTSNVTTTATISGSSVVTNYDFTYPNGTSVGSPKLINSAANMHPGNSMPTGDRMLWIKTNNNSDNAISDSVALNGRVLFTNATDNSQLFSGGVEFGAGFTRLPYDIESLGTEVGSGKAYATEIGVSPGLLDIVTWNGTGTASTDRRIPHSLGSVPGMIIVKRIDGNQDWYVYHIYKGVQNYATLNNSNSWQWTPAATPAWGAAPTATDFGINENTLSTQTGEYVAYVFAEDTPGKIKCGTYTGNGGDNYINIGLKPDFVLIKEAHDSGGLTNNGRNWLAANTFMMGEQRFWRPSDKTHLDGSNSEYINNNSTGIHVKGGSNSDHLNKPGSTYLYLAVAGSDANGLPIRSPDTTQLTFQDDTNLDQLTSGMTITSDGPASSIDLFSTQLYTGTSNSQKVNTGVDLSSSGGLFWLKGRDTDGDHWLYDSERGPASHLRIEGGVSATNHGASYNVAFDDDGVQVGSNGSINNSGNLYVGWSFAKKPGFFDVVSYTGDGDINKTVPHSLGSVPGMIIIKNISSGSTNWYTWHKDIGGTGKALTLNSYEAVDNNYNLFSTLPTDTVFSPGDNSHTNQYGQSFVAYVFADNPSNGVKCGTFSNNTGSWGPPAASDAVVDCGFAPQFIIAKTLDTLGGWYMMDSERGWSTSGDHQVAYRNKSLEAQQRNAEVTEGNFNFNATSTGFEVTYSKPGTWIFLAIGSPTGVGSPPTAELTADADPSTNTAIINAASWPTGDSVTGPATTATASVISSSYSVPAFATTLYSYTSTPQTITNGIDLAGDGGLIWTKWRSGGAYSTESHCLIDTERSSGSSTDQYGTFTPYLKTDSSNTQTNGNLINFNSDGYEITSPSSLLNHTSGGDYVSWTFRKAAGFFDIVTYTGTGAAHDISHSLGTVPGMVIYKGLDLNREWMVYHKDLGADQGLILNMTIASFPSADFGSGPTDTHISVGNTAVTNTTGKEFVAYVFADNPSNGIKCGSYQGTDYSGTVQVDCGFEAQWVMIKSTTGSDRWRIYWNTSSTPGSTSLAANVNSAEDGGGGVPHISFTSSGFTVENSAGYSPNWAGTFAYMAIGANAGEAFNLASNQLAISGTTTGTFQVGQNVKGSDYIYEIASQSSAITAVNDSIVTFADQDGLVEMTAPVSTETGTATGFITGSYSSPAFSTTPYTGTGSVMSISTGIDLTTKGLLWFKGRGGSGFSNTSHFHFLFDSERNNYGSYLQASETDAEGDFASYGWSPQPAADGTISNLQANLYHSNVDWVAWAFRATPGFFDIQTWTGNNVAGRTIPHNLGTAPGMILAKRVNDSDNWVVYHKGLGATHPMVLNETYAAEPLTNRWNDTEPTSTEFTVGTWPTNGDGKEYVAYIFADNPSKGIKCGSYTGSSSDVEVNVGFRPQWILLKSATSTSHWSIIDNELGVSDVHTPRLRADSSNAEQFTSPPGVTITSTGFTVTGGASDYNQSGQTHIYVVIGENAGDNVDLETNQALLQGITGTFSVGQTVTGSAQVADHPLTSEIEFKSVNGASGTGEFNGTDCTLNARIWTLETASDINGPWTVVDTYVDTDANASQDGATPWTTGTPTLQPNTIYRVKVQYQTADSAPVESTYHTFKTGAS